MKKLIAEALLGSRKLDTQVAAAHEEILNKAAILALREELGYLAQRSEPVEISQYQDKEPCPAVLSQSLVAMLDGRQPELLSELFETILENNWRIPSEYLPIVLEKGLKFHNLRPLILKVISQTGAYLASQNPEWAYASAKMDSWEGLQSEWQEAGLHRRQGILAQTRHRDPDLGRELVESRWEAESLSSAIWIINIFGKNLVANDEAFLERALDSRNATVRRKSAEYLAALPNSALSLRMFESMKTIIRLSNDSSEIEVNLPLEYPAQMQRDGLMKRMWSDPLKVENAQIADILGAVNLETIRDYWRLEPQEIITLAANHKYSLGLLKGFTVAAQRQKNSDWAILLLKQDDVGLATSKLLHILSTEDFASLIKDIDNGEFLDKENPLVKALWRYQGKWSKEVLDIWLFRLLSHIKKNPELEGVELSLRSSLKQAARLCPGSELSALKIYLEKINQKYPSWRIITNDAIALSKFRLRIWQAAKGA